MALICGDALHLPLAGESVHCVVTSPPYWSLRKYPIPDLIWGAAHCAHEWGAYVQVDDEREPDTVAGKSRTTDRFYGEESRRFNGNHQKHTAGSFCRRCNAWRGQLGLEPTIELYVAHIVAVFREVWRVLRADGTCWVNLGDSYAGSWGNYGGQNRGNGKQRDITNGSQIHQESYDGLERWRPPSAGPGLKPKDLCLIPARVALALQADGWYVRSEITLCKVAPMPESVSDRPTSATEKLYLLTKGERYFYDADAVREITGREADPAEYANGDGHRMPSGNFEKGVNAGFGSKRDSFTHPNGRNLRNWWEWRPDPFSERDIPPKIMCAADDPEAEQVKVKGRSFYVKPNPEYVDHYATFPRWLPERCIMAGTSEKGCCAVCGAPWLRVVERSGGSYAERKANGVGGPYNFKPNEYQTCGTSTSQTLGWQPTCAHDAPVQPCTVLDPFGGSGTVGEVAEALGRRWVCLDMSDGYIHKQAKKRTAQMGLFV